MCLKCVAKKKLLARHNKVAKWQCSIKKVALKNFAIFIGRTGKHQCWSLFLIQNIAKFLRTPILKNICERLLLKMCSFETEKN